MQIAGNNFRITYRIDTGMIYNVKMTRRENRKESHANEISSQMVYQLEQV